MTKRILVVEDQEDNRQILRDLLASVDYEMVEAENGEEALDRGRRAAAGPDPDGHPAADHGRLRGDAPDQGRSRDSRPSRSSWSRPMRCRATRARRAKPAATPTSPSPTARVSCWRRSASICRNSSSTRNSGEAHMGDCMHNPPRILIVDDNETNRDILMARLGPQGYDLKQAADGEEALAAAKEHLPDLILLDIMMPKIDGIEVCKRLKNDPSMPFTPIILCTAKADTKDVVAGPRSRRRRISHQADRPDRAGGAGEVGAAPQAAARPDQREHEQEPRAARRRPARRDRAHVGAEALPRAADRRAGAVLGRREAARQPPPRRHHRVLRSARLHRVRRDRRARRGDGGAARISRQPGRPDQQLRGHAGALRRRRADDPVQRSDPLPRPVRARA